VEKDIIRAKIVATEKLFVRYKNKQRKNFLEAIELIKAELDMDKRKELVDYLFADEVDEVIEYHVRKEYLK
jgi:hypothetical protein